MANALYPKFKQALLNKEIDMDTDTIKVILVDLADYAYSSAHDFLDDVAAGARVATGTLANKTITNGVFDADDVTLSSVTGDVSEALILYRDSGAEGTSHLIAFIDTGVTGLPVTPNGGNIVIQWNGSGIFSL